MKKLVLLTTAMVLLAACNRNTPATEEMPAINVETEQSQDQMMMESTEPTDAAMESETQSGTIQIEGDNFKFNVKEIKVKQGDSLTVNFTNKEGMHDFVIDELDVNTGMVAAGSSKEVTIPTDKPGTYEFYCSVGNHRQMGMKGTLIIE